MGAAFLGFFAGATFFSGADAAGEAAGAAFFGVNPEVFLGAVSTFLEGVAAGAALFGVTAFFVGVVVFFVAIFILSMRFTQWLRRAC